MTWDGLRLTTPLRSILDAAEYGTSPEQIVLAIWQAMGRGLILPAVLRATARDYSSRVVRRGLVNTSALISALALLGTLDR